MITFVGTHLESVARGRIGRSDGPMAPTGPVDGKHGSVPRAKTLSFIEASGEVVPQLGLTAQQFQNSRKALKLVRSCWILLDLVGLFTGSLVGHCFGLTL